MLQFRGKVPSALADAPPAVKLVYSFVSGTGDATISELVEATRLNNRTVRRAVNELVERGFVRKEPDYEDLRRKRIVYDRGSSTTDTDFGIPVSG